MVKQAKPAKEYKNPPLPDAKRQCAEIIEKIKSQYNPRNVEGMARFGINPKNTYGASIPFLRNLAKEVGRNHSLALQLWGSEIHEARILAAYVDELEKVTEPQMEKWILDFDSWDVCDQICGNLFGRTKFAWAKALEWPGRREEFVKRAGFVLMAALSVHDRDAPDTAFVDFLPAIVRESTDERNYVRKAVNWALRQIGKRNTALNRKALEVARKVAKMNSKSARWIASDAIRELTSEKTLKLMEKRALSRKRGFRGFAPYIYCRKTDSGAVKKIGLLVNPIAGMGGRAGLKGTDGVAEKAKALGAKPVSPHRAEEMLNALALLYGGANKIPAEFLTCSGKMGAEELAAAGITHEIVYGAPEKTSAADTIAACRRFAELGIDIIVFAGGDGTARDVWSAVGKKVAIFGIPSGVKMHSGVFGTTPEAAAQALRGFLNNELSVGEAEIVDVDEEAYRRGEWRIRLFGTCLSLVEPTYVQQGKMLFDEQSDEQAKEDIAEHVYEEAILNKDFLWILGSGGTLEAVGKRLGIDKTLLGIDAFAGGKQAGKDLNEKQLLALLDNYKDNKARIVVSPIGAQGFIFGRGNLQISAQVIRRVGLENIVVVATPGKLAATPVLRVDTGDRKLDALFAEKGYMLAVIGYRALKLVKIDSMKL